MKKAQKEKLKEMILLQGNGVSMNTIMEEIENMTMSKNIDYYQQRHALFLNGLMMQGYSTEHSTHFMHIYPTAEAARNVARRLQFYQKDQISVEEIEIYKAKK